MGFFRRKKKSRKKKGANEAPIKEKTQVSTSRRPNSLPQHYKEAPLLRHKIPATNPYDERQNASHQEFANVRNMWREREQKNPLKPLDDGHQKRTKTGGRRSFYQNANNQNIAMNNRAVNRAEQRSHHRRSRSEILAEELRESQAFWERRDDAYREPSSSSAATRNRRLLLPRMFGGSVGDKPKRRGENNACDDKPRHDYRRQHFQAELLQRHSKPEDTDAWKRFDTSSHGYYDRKTGRKQRHPVYTNSTKEKSFIHYDSVSGERRSDASTRRQVHFSPSKDSTTTKVWGSGRQVRGHKESTRWNGDSAQKVHFDARQQNTSRSRDQSSSEREQHDGLDTLISRHGYDASPRISQSPSIASVPSVGKDRYAAGNVRRKIHKENTHEQAIGSPDYSKNTTADGEDSSSQSGSDEILDDIFASPPLRLHELDDTDYESDASIMAVLDNQTNYLSSSIEDSHQRKARLFGAKHTKPRRIQMDGSIVKAATELTINEHMLANSKGRTMTNGYENDLPIALSGDHGCWDYIRRESIL